jgi:chromosome segregation ATPase
LAVVVLGAGGMFSTVVNGWFTVKAKRTKSPEVSLSEAELATKLYGSQIEEARKDKVLNETTLTALRGYIEELEAQGRDNQKTIIDLYRQIASIERRTLEKDHQIYRLEWIVEQIRRKLSKGLAITLDDLTHPADPGLPEDLERTAY